MGNWKGQNGDNFSTIPWQHLDAVAGEVVAESKTNLNESGFDDIKSQSKSKTNLNKSGLDDLKSESESKTNLNKSDFDDIKCKSESKTNLN